MIIIASAAYVGNEFQTELGRLPPSFLPVANKRLFEHQLSSLNKCFNEKIYLSLPEMFNLPKKDEIRLNFLNVEYIFVPEGLTLAESLLYVLNSVCEYDETVRILHGDTLVQEFPTGDSLIGLARTQDFYDWEIEATEATDELVWCGYFSFADVKCLIRCLTAARGNFVKAIRNYDNKIPLARAVIDKWHDLGHTNSYYKARANITTQRSFNNLQIIDGCIRKTGNPPNKIAAEAAWFEGLPSALKRYTPQLIDQGIDASGTPFYMLEYLCQAPLNEIYVHGTNPVYFWSKIFDQCNKWLNVCVDGISDLADINYQAVANERNHLLSTKTLARLERYQQESGISLDEPVTLNGKTLPSLMEIVDECIEQALSVPIVLGILHGDLCFSNILFDSRSDAIKVIDPRGMTYGGQQSLAGDLCYDLAKLSHSVIGLYDFIIAGAFHLERPDKLAFNFNVEIDARTKSIQKLFLSRTYLNLKPIDIMPQTILLFISMLPLHADNPLRQTAMLANGLRLYEDYMMV
ncbi:MAG: phosphotransferase [Methylovulum sp.]|nr:phosphotransferase [Methylovulum sp.]